MDAQNAPPDPAKPAEAAPEAAAIGRVPPSDHAAEPAPEAFAGAAGAGQGAQGAQALDYPVAGQDLASLAAQSAIYATRAFGPGTQRAYRSAWVKYSGWCAGHGLDPFAGAAGPLAEAGPLPLYVTHLAESGRAVALAAIATAYRLAGLALDLRDPKLAPVVLNLLRFREICHDNTRPMSTYQCDQADDISEIMRTTRSRYAVPD
jgi:hypothetical protein